MFDAFTVAEKIAGKKLTRRWQARLLIALVVLDFLNIISFGMKPEVDNNIFSRIFISIFAAFYLLALSGLMLSQKWALTILVVTLIFSLIILLFTTVDLSLNFTITIITGLFYLYLIYVCNKYDYYAFKK